MIRILRLISIITGTLSFIALLILYTLAFLSRKNRNIDNLLDKLAEKHPIVCVFSVYWWIVAIVINIITKRLI